MSLIPEESTLPGARGDGGGSHDGPGEDRDREGVASAHHADRGTQLPGDCIVLQEVCTEFRIDRSVYKWIKVLENWI